MYLDNGCETPDMKWIDLELKKTRLAMRDLANVVARQELLREYSDISSKGNKKNRIGKIL